MNDIQAREKLLQINIDDSSDDEETTSSPIKKSQKQPIKQNPQKDLTSDTKDSYQAFAEKQQSNQYVTNRDFKSVRYQSLRRNKSFKVKKSQQTSEKVKPIFNKSVSKFANIFQEAQEIQLRSSSKFAVHQQQRKEQSLSQELTVKSSFLKTSQFDVVLNAQQSPVLKISNQIKTLSKKNEQTKKQLKLTQQVDSKGKFMRKTNYLEKPMKQLLDRKLSSGVESRSTSRAPCQKQIKARLRTQEISDISSFVHKKIGSLQVLMSVIKKDSSGFNWLWPQIRMVDQKSNIHILSAKKKSANTTSNYYISRNQKQIDVQNNQYTGKVRSNFLGSCFNVFNQGINPQNVDKNEKNTKNVRQILATVIYQSQIANANPKTMRVYMVKAPYSYYDLEGTSIKEEQRNLEKLYQVGMNRNKIHVFKNRKPVYNKRQNRFVLNFDGRIKQPSTKNFILEDSQSKKQVLMFGKIAEQEYLLHLSSPLTPHIGLGIVLAELDSKIVCD